MERGFNLSVGGAKISGSLKTVVPQGSRKQAALATTPLALILSACGGGSTETAVSSNVLTLTKSADTYSATSVTGFAVNDTSTAKFDVSDFASNAYEIKLDATGTGVLEFDFADADDVVTLATGSKTSGFTTLKVTDGTIDATNADLTGITRVEVASGIKISLAQIKDIPTFVANSATSEITVEVASEAELTELSSLITAGTVKIFADTNPVKLVAAPAATISTEVLATKQAETTAAIKPTTEAPADTASTDTTTDTVTDDTTTDTGTATSDDTASVAARFFVSGDASGNYTPGVNNGNLTITASGSNYVLTPGTGTAATVETAKVTSLIVNSVDVTAAAVVLDGETVTGNSNVSITALEGDAAADLSNITTTGTRTAAVSDDVTFTGDLGTFTTTVASGKTLTGDVDVLQGKTINGAGTVAVTDLNTDLDADLSTITSTAVTATFNASGTFTGDLGTASTTVASGVTLTAAASVVAGKTITGGSVDITGNIAANTDISNVASTVDFTASTPTVAASKTLTLTAGQANAESFANSGTVVISATSGVQSTTVTGGVVKASMGSGADILILGAAENVAATDEIDMGADSDEVRITADDGSTGAVFDDAGSGWEKLVIAASSTASENVKVSLNHTATDAIAREIDASALTDTGAGFTLAIGTEAKTTGALSIKGSAGVNVVAGGAGDDVLDMGATAITAADEISLGAGTDEVKITAVGTDASTAVDQVFDKAGAGWEKLTISPSTSTAAYDSTVSLDFSSADTVAREIDASALVAATQIFTLELGTAANVDGVLTVTGGAAADVITTGDGADIVKGGAGGDTLNGGAGTDHLDLSDQDVSATTDDGIVINVSGGNITTAALSVEIADGSDGAGATAIADGKVAFHNDATSGSENATQAIKSISNFETYTTTAEVDLFYGGSGAETLNAGAGADWADAGTGADTLNMGDGLDTVVVNASDSVLTSSLGSAEASLGAGDGTVASVTGYKTVTGLVRSDGVAASETLDLIGSGNLVVDGTTDLTDKQAQLTTGAASTTETVKAMTVASGIAEFFSADNGSGTAILVAQDNVAAVIDAIQLVDLGDAGETLAFAYDHGNTGAATGLMVFQQGADDGTDSADILLYLVGQQATDALIITTNTAGANDLFIA
ncbi:hypothetical protein N8942_06735 [Planktomarina temperata]|nr:hypothetical protein [Planktomarina temperata]